MVVKGKEKEVRSHPTSHRFGGAKFARERTLRTVYAFSYRGCTDWCDLSGGLYAIAISNPGS